ncbi:MAG: F0F1 ATP synthase subunit B' [Kiloniellales bacterium]
MPQLDPTSFASQIFWLVVIFLALYFVIWKLALPKVARVLEERQSHIDELLDKASKLKDEAAAVLADYEKARADAQAQAQALLREAQEQMAAEAAKRQQEIGAKLAEEGRAAEARIADAREQAIGNLKKVAVEVASSATAKLIGSAPSAERAAKAVDAAAKGAT